MKRISKQRIIEYRWRWSGAIVGLLLVTVVALACCGATSLGIAQAEQPLIDTREGLLRAIRNAADGDVLLVGDIDFRQEGGGAKHEAERLILDKSLTIKSGKAAGSAVFVGGSFLVDGTKVAGIFSTLSFVNITFEGPEDVTSLTGADWDLTYDEGTGDPVSDHTVKAQYAIMCKGNVRATFDACAFNGYMHEQGAAVRLYYADYSAIPYVINEYGDNATCMADLDFNDCSFAGNAALYGGGAVYAEGNNRNISLHFADCTFEDNISGAGDYAAGGGAVYATQAVLDFARCRFSCNIGNHFYDGAEPLYDPDATYGGAVFCNLDCRLTATDCTFSANQASKGGALALLAGTGEIRGCVFDGNIAHPVYAPEIKSLTSCGGIGGAIYCNNPEGVVVVNTDITRNVAENAYAAVYTDYSQNLQNLGLGARDMTFAFCTVADNVAHATPEQFYKYGEPDYLWRTYPSNFWDIPYVHAVACIIIDETFTRAQYALPTQDNAYCYVADPAVADVDNYARAYRQEAAHLSFASAATVPGEVVATFFPERAAFLQDDYAIGAGQDAERLYIDPAPEAKHPLPAYAIALIVLACVLFAGGVVCGIMVVMRTRRKKAENEEALVAADIVDEGVKASQETPNEPTEDAPSRLPTESDIESIMASLALQCLSEREREVLSAVLAGKKRKEIAEALFVTESTVKKHIASIYDKLHVSSRAELLSVLYSIK